MASQAQTLRCVATVGAAYTVQGIVAGVGAMLLATLAGAGTPIEQQAGLLASGAIPWVLKCFVALLLDAIPSWSLRRRAVVLASLQLCAAAAMWGLAFAWQGAIEDGSFGALTVAWLALNFLAALQDVVVDNFALDTLRGRQSWTATAMGLGHVIGMVLLGSIWFRAIAVDEGMAAGFVTMACALAILALACGALSWMPGTPAREVPTRPSESRRSTARLLGLLGLLPLFTALMLGVNLTSAILYEFLFGYLRWELDAFTQVLMPIGAVGGILGALAMGPLVAKLGPARASMIVGGALGLLWLGFAANASRWDAPGFIPSFAGCEAALQWALTVGLHALALIAVARSPWPTTAFVLAMAALNLPRALAPLLSPTLVEYGWVGVFVACGAIQLIAVVGLWPLRGWTRER